MSKYVPRELEYLKKVHNKTIISCSFCDIKNNQGLGKCYQPLPLTSILIIPDITKAHPIIVY